MKRDIIVRLIWLSALAMGTSSAWAQTPPDPATPTEDSSSTITTPEQPVSVDPSVFQRPLPQEQREALVASELQPGHSSGRPVENRQRELIRSILTPPRAPEQHDFVSAQMQLLSFAGGATGADLNSSRALQLKVFEARLLEAVGPFVADIEAHGGTLTLRAGRPEHIGIVAPLHIAVGARLLGNSRNCSPVLMLSVDASLDSGVTFRSLTASEESGERTHLGSTRDGARGGGVAGLLCVTNNGMMIFAGADGGIATIETGTTGETTRSQTAGAVGGRAVFATSNLYASLRIAHFIANDGSQVDIGEMGAHGVAADLTDGDQMRLALFFGVNAQVVADRDPAGSTRTVGGQVSIDIGIGVHPVANDSSGSAR